MDFAFTEGEEALQQEVRDWLKKEVPPRWCQISPGDCEENDEIWSIARQKLAEMATEVAEYS